MHLLHIPFKIMVRFDLRRAQENSEVEGSVIKMEIETESRNGLC